MGAQPTKEIVAKENKVTIMDHKSGQLTEEIVDDPMAIPRRLSQGWKPYLTGELPDAFCGKSTITTMFRTPVFQDMILSYYGSISKCIYV